MDLVFLQEEKLKKPIYQPKGYGFIFSIIIAVSYVTIIPYYIAPLIWPKKIECEKTFAL